MFPLKRISPSGVPAALQKAERYRLLNDSTAAESICLDILGIEPENQQALVTLVLSITDQFTEDTGDAVKPCFPSLMRSLKWILPVLPSKHATTPPSVQA